MNVGDSLGIIQKVSKNNKEFWRLTEDKINKISITKKYGKRYYTKKFYPLDANDVDSNTKIMEESIGKGYVFVKEVFGLNEKTRHHAEGWVKWANENMDKVVGVLD